MADTIVHRGPDDDGYHVSGQIGLGFRRLSIIDLSGGHQPLCNENGTCWIVFNGEIYNYQELRDYLLTKGHIFRTHSDTEVIVHLYEELGEASVEWLRGMFAFAIWDENRKSLFLARDRVGIKPLYYWMSSKALVFASEIKAILADPEVHAEVRPAMIDRFLTFDYMPGEETLLRNIYKLPPGFTLMVRDGKPQKRQYWDLHFRPGSMSLREAETQLVQALEDSVRSHMISDVPVGFLLSGGVDSTAMLSFAAGKTDYPLSTYTIGFSDPTVTDERPYAKLAADYYGSIHHETTIGSRDFADFLPKYVWHMEEPVCEPPAVALFYVSKLARDFVKVLISGEGGDEAFAGYSNYRWRLWLERLKGLSQPLNWIGSGLFSSLAAVTGSTRIATYASLFNTKLQDSYYSRTSHPFRLFNRYVGGLYSREFAQLVDKKYSLRPVTRHIRNADRTGVLSQMLYVDTKTWLPDDLLIKADKMTMANSIELRVPLLDHKVLEFAASLPPNFKVRGFTTKYIAKKTLKGRLPSAILNRKKAGFPVPYGTWLRQDLRDWTSALLLDAKSLRRGYFRKEALENLLAEDQKSGGNSKEIFSLAVLELWHREFLERQSLSQPTFQVPISEAPNQKAASGLSVGTAAGAATSTH